jgi:hypothetical protein
MITWIALGSLGALSLILWLGPYFVRIDRVPRIVVCLECVKNRPEANWGPFYSRAALASHMHTYHSSRRKD